MITDIFARRYACTLLRSQYFREDQVFFNQAVTFLGNQLWCGFPAEKVLDATEAGLKAVHDVVALEVGRQALSDQYWWSTNTWNGNTTRTPHKNTYAQMVKVFLLALPTDPSEGDVWVKERLSVVELAFRYRAAQIAKANAELPLSLARAETRDASPSTGLRVPGRAVDGIRTTNTRINDSFKASVAELNERMRHAGYRLNYHNGFIQLADDEMLGSQVAKPFWDLVTDPRFANVDLQTKEAIDRRDNGDRTAAFHAVCALESCIKIICEIKGWAKGNEKGAADFVNHLNSKQNGRFIEPWEGETLKSMFSDVRNPFAHGPGQAPMPTLTPQQTDWAIDTSMTWCKALLRRL